MQLVVLPLIGLVLVCLRFAFPSKEGELKKPEGSEVQGSEAQGSEVQGSEVQGSEVDPWDGPNNEKLYQELFNDYDVDKDGKITKSDLMDVGFGPSDADDFIEKVGLDNGQKSNYNEFVNYFKKLRGTRT